MLEVREISFEMYTLRKLVEFKDVKRDLITNYNNVTITMIREYIRNGKKLEGIPNEVYNKIDRLNNARMEAIRNEAKHIKAQAKRSNIEIDENYYNGRSLRPFYNEDESVQALEVYKLLLLYGPEELATYGENGEEKFDLIDEERFSKLSSRFDEER